MRLTRAGRVSEATTMLRDKLDSTRQPPRMAAQGKAAQGKAAQGKATQGKATQGKATQGWAGASWGTPLAQGPALRPMTAPSAAPLAKVWPSGAPDHAPGSWTEHTVRNAHGSRAYKLYVPTRDTQTPRPLVVMLHGCTQSPDDFAAGTRMNALAEEFDVLVAYPEQSRAANSSKCWNWFKPSDQARDAGEPSLIADMVRQIGQEHAVDARRVFVAGLSAGGAAAAVMAQIYPDLFAGAGVHSGLACGAARDLPTALTAMRGGSAGFASRAATPLIVFQGTADHTVHPANAPHVLAQAVDGLPAPQRTQGRSTGGVAYQRAVYHRGERVVAESWQLEGVGHAWSGGSAVGSYTDPRGPDASREMLRFFLALA